MLLNLNNRTIHTIKITINFITALDDSPIYITLQNYTASDSVFHTELANQTTVQVVKTVCFPMDIRYQNIVTCLLVFLHFAFIHGQLFCLILYQ